MEEKDAEEEEEEEEKEELGGSEFVVLGLSNIALNWLTPVLLKSVCMYVCVCVFVCE